MSVPVSISKLAEEDLAGQYHWYSGQAGGHLAERFLEAFSETVSVLCRQPGIGKQRNFRSPLLSGIRSIPLGNPFGVHLIFFRAEAGHISLERILHGARDLPARLLDPPSER